jgi:hypothetical protein
MSAFASAAMEARPLLIFLIQADQLNSVRRFLTSNRLSSYINRNFMALGLLEPDAPLH